jgi:hypothetical protein
MTKPHTLWQPGTATHEPHLQRELIGIGELDSRLQEQIVEYGGIKQFRFSVWRDESDPTGCNWNARIDRIAGDWTNDSGWWDAVPQLRDRFNLS